MTSIESGPDTAAPLSTLIEDRARHDPDALALVFVAEDGSQNKIDAAGVRDAAVARAAALGAVGVGPGDRIVIALGHSVDLFSAVWGALRLGAVPSIFRYARAGQDPVSYQMQLTNLVAAVGAKWVVGLPEHARPLRLALCESECGVIVSEDLRISGTGELPPAPAPEDLAVIQHTSGTTGLPKAVAHSHEQVLRQVQLLAQTIGVVPTDRIVCWMPLFHDMGLVTGFFLSAVAQVPLVLMSPYYWARNPASLLRAVSEHRGTLCWMPNFAFNHCARASRSSDLAGVDLSSWRLACNGSEPIRHDSHAMFLERFSRYGFHDSALCTAYGMTECVGHVTIGSMRGSPQTDWVSTAVLQEEGVALPASPGDDGATAVVGCGTPMQGIEIGIVGQTGEPLPSRQVGEIVLRGDVLVGYEQPEQTAAAFRKGWFHTGDMGYLVGTELFVCGRKTDVILVAGRNVYPEDIEDIANRVEGVAPGRTAAFGFMDTQLGTERVVLVCEVKGAQSEADLRRIEAQIRTRVVSELDLVVGDVLLVAERGWVIKTSSGKIAHAANREKYLAQGHLE